MSEVYNPETVDYEKLAAMTTEARRLRQARDEAVVDHEKRVFDRQLSEVERRISSLQRRFR